MINPYGLPPEELRKVFARDRNACVYCHKPMTVHGPENRRGDWYTIEHLNRLPPYNNAATVAFCCGSCNSSRSNKTHEDWFRTSYCVSRNITEATVAEPVREYITALAASHASWAA